MQHSNHVAAYYWHLHKQPGTTPQSEAYYWKSQDYGMAAKDAMHADRWFRYGPPALAPVKVPARNLLSGDQVGSGEIVKWVGVGVRTPRGKVEIQLEKNGRTRLAIWNASTLINVRRAA